MRQLAVMFLLTLWPAIGVAEVFYVDCSDQGYQGLGTFQEPFDSLAQVASNNFQDGDSLYFRADVECKLTSSTPRLVFQFSGTSAEQRSVIGCYVGEDHFDCSATPHVMGKRGIISGQDHSYPRENWQAAFEVRGVSYLTLREIEVREYGDPSKQGMNGLRVSDGASGQPNHSVNIENCYSFKGSGAAISMYVTDTGVIQDNTVEFAGFGKDFAGVGAAMEISSLAQDSGWQDRVGRTRNILIQRNLIMNSKHEGSGATGIDGDPFNNDVPWSGAEYVFVR